VQTAQHPIPDDLKPDPADLRRLGTRCKKNKDQRGRPKMPRSNEGSSKKNKDQPASQGA
jgi:hypothetical protein